MRGTVKWFREDKGYGFITPQNSNKDIFVHVSALVHAQTLAQNTTVEFDIVPGKKGEQAANVKIVL